MREVEIREERGAMAEKGGLGTVGALSLSVISSVAIVICNKTLITTLGFCFGTRNSSDMCSLASVYFLKNQISKLSSNLLVL